MSTVTSTCYIIFYGYSTSIEHLGLDNLILNGIVYGIVQTISYILMSFVVPYMQRKKWLLIFQGSTVFFTVVLALLSKFLDKEKAFVKYSIAFVNIIVLGFLNCACFSLIYSYISELFPTRIRGMANSLTLFLGRIAGSFAPYLGTLAKDNGFNIMVGCGLTAFLCFPLLFFLDETLIVNEKKRGREAISDMKTSQSQNLLESGREEEGKEYVDGIDY